MAGMLRRRLLGLLLCASAYAGAQSPTLKSWSIPLQRGTMQVNLMQGSGDRLVVSFGTLPCGACAAPGEMGGVLQKVLQGMSAEHLDPHRINIIEARVSEARAKHALAESALRSPEWRACMVKRVCGVEATTVRLLNESRAFADMDDALRPYGLTLRVVSAEKVSVDRVSTMEGLGLPAGTKRTVRVPVDGSLELLVEPRR